MSTQIKLADYRPEHFEAIQGFVEIIQDTESKLVSGLKSGAEIQPWYAQSLVDSIQSKQGVILVAEVESKSVPESVPDSVTESVTEAVGFVCAWVEGEDKLAIDSLSKCAYISDICVSSKWRGHGIAGKLLQAIELRMKALGCQRIRLCAKNGNVTATRCYEGQGYQTYEITLSKALT